MTAFDVFKTHMNPHYFTFLAYIPVSKQDKIHIPQDELIQKFTRETLTSLETLTWDTGFLMNAVMRKSPG